MKKAMCLVVGFLMMVGCSKSVGKFPVYEGGYYTNYYAFEKEGYSSFKYDSNGNKVPNSCYYYYFKDANGNIEAMAGNKGEASNLIKGKLYGVCVHYVGCVEFTYEFVGIVK